MVRMARMRTLAERAEQLLGSAVVSTTPVAGGDVCTSTRLRLSDGRSALIKTRPHAPENFFAAEARGLCWLAEPGVAEVAEVLGVQDDCIVLGWIEPTRPSPESAAGLGRMLARLHASGADGFGADEDGYIATLPLPNKTADSWPEFFAVRRVLPYLKLAADRGHIEPAGVDAIESVVRRIVDLAGPAEPPARIHGDLWSGNIVWNVERQAVLVDPAAHGGHRETDLAMLALFGLPQLARVQAAYAEASPLADGWEERQSLHQLFPLLVHAALFGGRYGQLATEAAGKLA
jgi:fructosamine-3-kinase